MHSPPQRGPPRRRPIKLSMPAPLARSQDSASGTEPSQTRHRSRNPSMSSAGSRSTQRRYPASQPQMVVVPPLQQEQVPQPQQPYVPPSQYQQPSQPTSSTFQRAFVDNTWSPNSVASQQPPATPGSRSTEPITIAVQTPVRLYLHHFFYRFDILPSHFPFPHPARVFLTLGMFHDAQRRFLSWQRF